ncbi:MAG: reverse transcriptase-like protein [Candidatus Pacebacteria bacterium]|nr:reverse transcriptase-like protein [Candidatus Paceibacterota bacterium]MBP9840146.1 reverse transcriptase-like protein [Candidatus Paceibacterota bacterium]
MRFYIQADGGARGNPGPAGSGAVVRDAEGNTILEVSEFIGHATNNVAEYTAIIRALEGLKERLGADASQATVTIEMDSKLVVEQMEGRWKVKHPNMRPLAARAAVLALSFGHVSYAHIPREKNGAADALANAAMDRGQ